MGWRTILWELLALLIILIVTHCGGEYIDWRDRMWTEPVEPASNIPFDVFCSHKGFNIEQKRVQIRRFDSLTRRYHDVLTVRVNDTTVKHSVKQSPPRRLEVFLVNCDVQDETIGHMQFWMDPFPVVRDFECRWEKPSDALECTFSQWGEKHDWKYINYFLVINDSDRRVECEQSSQNLSRIQCNCIRFSSNFLIDNGEHNPYSFKLFFQFVKNKRMQEFKLFREQIEVPKWTFKAAKIWWQNHEPCLRIDYDEPDLNPGQYKWRILFQPLNPKYKQWEAKVHIGGTGDICFDYPSYGDQHYELRLWRRFDKPDSPWTSLSRVFLFSSLANVPDRPPQLLPNGFYHDPEKGELYVYWKPLDELEFGCTGFKYAVSTDSGHEALVLGNHSALIRNWNSTQPATVTIWSDNFIGRSVNNSQLHVPILANAERRQPREVWYHIDNNTVTWLPPTDREKFIRYAFYWCLISKNTSGFCDDLESIQFTELGKSEKQFQIDKSIALYHTAVAAEYSENISGGLIWSRPRPSWVPKKDSISYLVMTVIFVVVVTLGLFFLIWNIFRKLKAMSYIEVELPDFLIVPLKTTNFEGLQPSQDPIMANISPKVMNNVLGKTLEESIEENYDPIVSPEDSTSDDTNHKPDQNHLTSSLQYTSIAFGESSQEDSHDPPVASTLAENCYANVAGYTEISCTKI